MVETLRVLLSLAEKGAAFGAVNVTTVSLSEELGISQQSASRILAELEERGLVERKRESAGFLVSLTPAAVEELKKTSSRLSRIFNQEPEITGEVIAGIGEAAWYVKKYASRIRNLLGFAPFPGTLNIKTEPSAVRKMASVCEALRVEEFREEGRTFGGISLYPARIQGNDAAVIMPDRSRYGPEVVEVIAPFNLRKKLGLKTGDTVTVHVKKKQG